MLILKSEKKAAQHQLQRTGGMLPPIGMLPAISIMKSASLAQRPSAAEPIRWAVLMQSRGVHNVRWGRQCLRREQ